MAIAPPDFRLLFESAPGCFLVLAPDLRIVAVSERYLRATMTKRDDILGRGLFEVFPDDPNDPAATGTRNLRRSLDIVLGGKKADTMAVQKYAVRRPDGTFEERHWSPVNTPVLEAKGEIAYIIHCVEDVTDFVRLSDGVEREVYRRAQEIQAESRRLLEEQDKLRDQLLQSRKLEAIGRLAGGIAHDFNNILTAIMGYGELMFADLKPEDPKRADVGEIIKASERAAALTRQLLAFSRRQLLAPKIVEPNGIVRGVEPMLRRILGEDVVFATALRDDCGRVKADTGQLEQVIVNLAVNARDAMPKGGRLTIETARAELRDGWDGQPELPAGSYAVLAVTDTGVGMDAATLARVFEPFFTTKEQGKGTGLGLATVYGIVKQSGGAVFAYSEPGHGSCFKVYLPRVEEKADPLPAPPRDEPPARGSESILLVEDDPAVRKFVRRLLTENGYRVLEADGPEEALRLCESGGAKIDLLLTDVVMPGMRGDELARRLAPLHPRMKVVFTSGYTEAGITERRLLGEHDAFVQKPIQGAVLLRALREALDGASRAE